jgi:hypothetical protein
MVLPDLVAGFIGTPVERMQMVGEVSSRAINP